VTRKMSRKMQWALLPPCGIMAIAAVYWISTPVPGVAGPAHATLGECVECHEDSVPLTHTSAFVDLEHGVAAADDRILCLGCHEASDCDDCHLTEPPAWETDAFRHPDRGPNERDEHLTLSSAHADSCMECHTQRFQVECATCHRADEWLR